jgi:predicted choloylglycine hydrolase
MNIQPSSRAIEIVASGDPFAMGHAQGTALREHNRSCHSSLAKLEAMGNLKPWWLPYPLFLRIAEKKAERLLNEALSRDYPEMLHRLDGMSKGSGIRPGALYLLNALETALSSARGYTEAPLAAACSAMAVRGRRSAGGAPIIARNFDYLPLFQPFYTLRRSRPARGFRSLDFIVSPLAGAVDGINEKGLSIAYNYAYTTDSFGTAAPISMLISETLQKCATVAEAAAWIGKRPRAGGALLMLADAHRDMGSLELSSTRWQLRRPAPGEDVICHANSFVTTPMRGVQIADDAVFTRRAPAVLRGRRLHESSEERCRRLKHLLSQAPVIGENELSMIMGDHGPENIPSRNTICMHSDYWHTTASIQLLPSSRRMRVSFTSACQAAFQDFEF